MEAAAYFITDDIEYFAELFEWIKANGALVSPSDTTFKYAFPAVLKVIVVPPDLTQIKLQTDSNPALFIAPPTKMVQSTEFMYSEWSGFLKEWRGPDKASVPDPAIQSGSTILARGHARGTKALSPAQLCLDAAIIWHEAGHAIAIASSKANTEGYAYEFEICTLAYAITKNAIAAFGFGPADVVDYLEKYRIDQFKTNSGQQQPRVKAALAILRNVLSQRQENALANRILTLEQQL